MEYLFICYKRCSTCNKAKKYLSENNVDFTFREITEENPTVKELTAWIKLSGLPIKRFFNTSGTIYRKLNLKDKLEAMSDQEKIELLATDGMLVKRPLLVSKDQVLVGFKEKEYELII